MPLDGTGLVNVYKCKESPRAHDICFGWCRSLLSHSFYFFLFLGNGPFFSKRLPPSLSILRHACVEEAVSIWRAIATLNVKIFYWLRRMYIKPGTALPKRRISKHIQHLFLISIISPPAHTPVVIATSLSNIVNMPFWLPIVPFTLLLFPQLISKWFRCWCCDLPLRKTILSEPLKIHPTFQ